MTGKAALLILATGLAAPCLAAEPAPATQPARSEGHAHAHGHGGGPRPAGSGHDATVRHSFADVERWVKVFDDPERDAWQKPEALVKALALVPGQRVADIGAGTGYFERWLAAAVGERGTVYAVDVEPELVAHLRTRAEREQTANVVPVLGSLDHPRLPPGSLDLVLIVDTYHHLDDRPGYFRRLATALAPGGRIAIVDFHKRELPVGPPLEHKLAREAVVAEMTLAGFQLVQDLDVLPYQYALLFTR